MLTASSLLITLGVTFTLGLAWTLYSWQIRRKLHETRQGLVTLAGMRWREFSNFVVEALQAQGFEADHQPSGPHNAHKSDLRLIRDGRIWLLSCKQGVKYKINAEQVDGLAGAVNFHGAGGGIIATLGHVQSDARKNSQGLELLDGKAVWTLVEHLLPNGLHESVAQQARRRTVLEVGLGWGAALLVGIIAAAALAPTSSVAPGTLPPPANPSEVPAATAVAPSPVPEKVATPVQDEQTQRELITLRVDALPGVRHAVWSTRSNLLVGMAADAVDGPAFTAPICKILEDYPDLRASRVQLQPLDGSSQSVRFMQCHQY